MMIVDIVSFEVVDANDGALLILERREGRSVDLADRLQIDARHRDLLNLVTSGRLDGFDARVLIPRAGSTPVERRVWVRAIEEDAGPPQFAVVVVTEGGAIDATARLPMLRPTSMVAGAVDDEWVVEWVSSDVTALLGYDHDEFVGMPLLGLIHPESAADFVLAITHAADSTGGAVLRARIRRSDQSWRPAQVIVSPRVGDTAGAMFLLLPAEAVSVEVQERLSRVAGDMHVGALAGGSELGSDALTGLSSRQWEIVTRLQRGERVPGIARAMYLSQSTVRNHLTQVFRKFGVHSQADLLAHLRERTSVSASAAGESA